jgi:nitric oxide reductase NorD protein
MSVSPSAIAFEDIHRSMSIFAEGIFGESLHLEALEAGPDGIADTGVDLRRIRPKDGLIFLPATFESYGSRAHNIAACQVTVLRQIEYLKVGAWRFQEKIRALRALESTTQKRKQDPIEATDLERRYVSIREHTLLDFVFETLEERRIDERLIRQYPGTLPCLRRMLGLALDSRAQGFQLTGHKESFTLHSQIKLALETLQRFSLDLWPERPAIRLSELQTKILETASRVTTGFASTQDSAEAAIDIHSEVLRWASRFGELIAQKPLPTEANSESDEAHAQTSIAQTGEPIDQAPQDRNSRRGETHYQYANEPGVALEELGKSLSKIVDTSSVETSKRMSQTARSYLYKEWNHDETRYLPAWCRVFEQGLNGDDTEFIKEVRKRHPRLWQQVKRSFAAIRPAGFKRVHRLRDGDEIDFDRIIERRAEHYVARSDDDALFVRRERMARDVSVAFLVDMSASTSMLIPDLQGEPAAKRAVAAEESDPDSNPDYPYLYGGGMSTRDTEQSDTISRHLDAPRRVIDVAQDAVALMCEALHQLGDGFAVYGFSGDGREQVDFFIAKDFNEHLSGRTWAAIAAMQPKQSSRVGPAIRHSVHKIRKRSSARRLLIVISDGYPQDRDYGPTREDVEYGIQDTAQALREAEQQGIQTFFVTIDPAGYDYLGRMCPENRYLLIQDVLQLPAALGKIYQAMKAVPSRRP